MDSRWIRMAISASYLRRKQGARISPEGKVVGEVKFPTRCITCPVFIGTELWVTSADEENEEEVESKKYGGGIFKVDVGIGGLKEFKFKLDSGVKVL